VLLERGEELERIDEALAEARRGLGSVVLIEGPAGVGKTELISAARRRAEAAGMRVLRGRGSELESERAFGVVRQLLEPAVVTAERGGRGELFSGAAALARPLFVFDREHDEASAGLEPAAVEHGLYWLCATFAQVRPVVLLVDDAHWADLASLRFLTYLARRLEGLGLALVVGARPAQSPAEEEHLVRLADDAGTVNLMPRPLSVGAVESLLSAELGRRPDPVFVEACHAGTGGTPFLVRELIRALRAAGVSPLASSVGQIRDLGPRSVARSVVARARGLGAGALELARAVAVLGADADARRTQRLAGVPEATADRLLDGLATSGIIELSRPIEFVHPIVRAAVYGEIPVRKRSRLHRRAAALLAGEGAVDERIATHLLASDPAGDEDAVDLLVRVAEEALSRGAPASAAAYLGRALEEPPSARRHAEVLDRLGSAEIQAGRLGPATEHLADARALTTDLAPAVRISRRLVAALSIQGRYAEAAAVVGDLLSQHEALNRDLVAALRGELLLLTLFEPAIRADVEDRLGDVDRRPDARSPGVRTYLSAQAMHSTLELRPAAEVIELCERAREAGIVEEVASGAIAWNQVLFPLIFADGFALAERMVADAVEHLRRRPSVVGSARAYCARAFLHARRGALRDAIADAGAAAEAARTASFIGLPVAISALVDALVEQGDLAEADAALADAEMAAEVPLTFLHSWVIASRAGLRLAQDRVDEAIVEFEELGRRVDRFRLSNPATVGYRSGMALALLRQGERERATGVAETELELARRWGAPRTTGVSLRVLGLCRGDSRGTELLRESVEVLAGSGARLEHARSLVELGAALRRAGTRAAAREPLHAGMELAHRCGAAPLVDRAREELLVTGARPRRIMRTGVDALTPSELRVVRMAAAGMTNREIAEALYVSTRTVEGHLTHAFQKLDIDSRRDLAEQLAEEPGS
jgi:DNA-binding CsgD family transcriptional regulator/tetratricopeptide (TPR) repeat protein